MREQSQIATIPFPRSSMGLKGNCDNHSRVGSCISADPPQSQHTSHTPWQSSPVMGCDKVTNRSKDTSYWYTIAILSSKTPKSERKSSQKVLPIEFLRFGLMFLVPRCLENNRRCGTLLRFSLLISNCQIRQDDILATAGKAWRDGNGVQPMFNGSVIGLTFTKAPR